MRYLLLLMLLAACERQPTADPCADCQLHNSQLKAALTETMAELEVLQTLKDDLDSCQARVHVLEEVTRVPGQYR